MGAELGVHGPATAAREQMSIVVVGHVDHGKSTVIGRLLADTGSFPEGKVEAVRAFCARNARPFEYAFLLDALKDEQAQGITIDSARCFFNSARRDYVIIDAPGHVEFLKNMVSGAARAEAALLVIDAQEGVRENSRRHGTMLSMLGVRQLVVLVNKMDLVGYDLGVFEAVRAEYAAFLERLGLNPAGFVPICARDGVNLATRAPWWDGPSVLEHLDAFAKERTSEHKPFRMPLQDIYKFTAQGDDRRILAGTIETGSIAPGDPVIFHPSGKRTRIASIESFQSAAPARAGAGEAVGFTMTEEIYVRPGEVMCRADEPAPAVSTRLRVNIFWMGKAALRRGKTYKLKLAAARVPVQLATIAGVMDASDLSSTSEKQQVDRHDVAECVFETARPIAFDVATEIATTGRFVIVDNYEIAGGGIVLEALPEQRALLEEHVHWREAQWESGSVLADEREGRNGHRARFVVLTGGDDAVLRDLGKALERRLFGSGFAAYYLSAANVARGVYADIDDPYVLRTEGLRRLGELARLLTDSGQITITALGEADRADLDILRALSAPQEILTVQLPREWPASGNGHHDPVPLTRGVPHPVPSADPIADLVLDGGEDSSRHVERIVGLLEDRQILPDFSI